MGSKSASGSVGALPESDRVVIVSENSRNAAMMGESLPGVSVDTVVPGEARDSIGASTSHVDAVVVDTDTVTEDVTALVEGVLNRELPVVLLSQEAPAAVREDAAATDGVEFREKPVRSADLRSAVRDAVN
jgi:CheY-like chemotaxis protein